MACPDTSYTALGLVAMMGGICAAGLTGAVASACVMVATHDTWVRHWERYRRRPHGYHEMVKHRARSALRRLRKRVGCLRRWRRLVRAGRGRPAAPTRQATGIARDRTQTLLPSGQLGVDAQAAYAASSWTDAGHGYGSDGGDDSDDDELDDDE